MPGAALELRHLRYFVALAEQLNFTQAAEKVHVTQSTLSHQIKQLEDELGCRLFDRVGRRVAMTEGGELFLERAQRAIREVDEGVWALRQAEDELSGQVRVAATHTFNARIIPKSVARFIDRHPSVSVAVHERSGDGIAQGLLAGDFDLGLTYKPAHAANLHFEPLYNEEMVLAVGPDHHFAARRFIKVVELHMERLVLLPPAYATRTLLEDCFRMANAVPVVVAEMEAIGAMIEFVKLAPVAAIVSEHSVKGHDVRAIPIESPTPVRTPGLLWRSDSARTAATRHLASIIRGVANAENARVSRAAQRAPGGPGGRPRSR
ncbi:MAG: LysR substrate-binding domain-containing protein [Luteibacter sp.]